VPEKAFAVSMPVFTDEVTGSENSHHLPKSHNRPKGNGRVGLDLSSKGPEIMSVQCDIFCMIQRTALGRPDFNFL
jgi:hypothetical protein